MEAEGEGEDGEEEGRGCPRGMNPADHGSCPAPKDDKAYTEMACLHG
jgi:hypothetical protein